MRERLETTDQRRLWDVAYEGKEDLFGIEPSELGRRALRIFQEEGVKEVLELGCGQGRDTALFLKKGMGVVAIDYSAKGIDRARERALREGSDRCLVLQRTDIREDIRMPNESVDAVFSHLLLCMELKETEIASIMKECLRVLRPGGLNIYSVRSDTDPQFGKGIHCGEDMYVNDMGFIVHFFNKQKIERLAKGYELLWMREFEEPTPPFPRRLYEVVLRKPVREQRS